MAKIEDEIKQKQFKNEFQKAQVNIIYTASWLAGLSNTALKPFKISVQQFNILRILRGASPTPVTIKTLTDRMVDKMSNASRLVEKLRKKELVERTVSATDRRRVNVIITLQGLELLEQASEAIEQNFDRIKNNLGLEKATLLNQLLDELRA